MIARKRHISMILTFISVGAAVFLIFRPWLTVPSGADLLGETRDYYGIFRLFAMLDVSRGSGLIADMTTLERFVPILIVATCLILVALIAYTTLVIKSNRRALLFGFIGFIGTIVLAILFMNTVNEGNSESAYAGPGLFAARFLTITPTSYILLGVAIFGAVVVVPMFADYIKLTEMSEGELVLIKANLTFKQRFALGRKNLLRDIIRDRWLYIILAPMLAYYVIFYFVPFAGLRMAFMDFRPLLGFEGSPWVGWRHFINFFTGPFFWRVFRNTLVLGLYGMLWSFPIPIILAILFNELTNKRFRNFVQSVSYIPRFISVVVVSGMLITLLTPSAGGLINSILMNFGIIERPIYFIMESRFFRSLFIFQGVWTWAGFTSIIYFNTIISIDEQLYEAAKIDGAGRLKQIRHVMLPHLYPTMAIMLILAVGNFLNTNLEQVILLARPATYEVSDVILYHVFRIGITNSPPNFSLGTAVGLFNGVVALIMVVSANKIAKKIGGVGLF